MDPARTARRDAHTATGAGRQWSRSCTTQDGTRRFGIAILASRETNSGLRRKLEERDVKTAKRESAESVRALLDRAGLNQCEAARLIGVSERTMRRYVSGNPDSGVIMPAPAKALLVIVTDQLAAARSVRRQHPMQRSKRLRRA